MNRYMSSSSASAALSFFALAVVFAGAFWRLCRLPHAPPHLRSSRYLPAIAATTSAGGGVAPAAPLDADDSATSKERTKRASRRG